MEYIGHFFSLTVKLFALVTPPVVLSAFLSGTKSYDDEQKKRTALRTSVAMFILGIVLYLIGEPLFSVFGTTLDAFRIGAGALLFLTAVSLMNETASHPYIPPDAGEISIVPLAIPLAMGPATIGTIMVMGATDVGFMAKAIGLLALAVTALGIYIILRCAGRVERILGRTGLAVLSKLTGLLMAAIAAQVVFTGIRSFLR